MTAPTPIESFETAARKLAAGLPPAERAERALDLLEAAGRVLRADPGLFARRVEPRLDPGAIAAALESGALERLSAGLLAHLRSGRADSAEGRERAARLVRESARLGRALAAVSRLYGRGRTPGLDERVGEWIRERDALEDLARERAPDLWPALETLAAEPEALAEGWGPALREELEETEARLLAPLPGPPCEAGILGRRMLLAAWTVNGLESDAPIPDAVDEGVKGLSFTTHLAECGGCARDLARMLDLEAKLAGAREMFVWCGERARVPLRAAAASPESHPLTSLAVEIPGRAERFAFLPGEGALRLFLPGGGPVEPGWKLYLYRDERRPPIPREPAIQVPFAEGTARWDKSVLGVPDTRAPEAWRTLAFWLEAPDGRRYHSFRVLVEARSGTV